MSFETSTENSSRSEGATSRQESARFELRNRTAACHLDTEAAFAGLDLAKAADYSAFLGAHLDALETLEPALAKLGWPQWQPRAALIRRDLEQMAPAAPRHRARPAPDFSAGEAWGVQYVIEGSALGGQILAKQVGPDLPVSYLTRGQTARHSWREFCDALDKQAHLANNEGGTANWIDEAEQGARNAFAAFQISARMMEYGD